MRHPVKSTNVRTHASKARPASTLVLRRRGVASVACGLAVLALVVSACGDPIVDLPVGCTEQFVYGISVQVVDVTSGAQRASGSTLTVREGSYEEVVTGVTGNNTMVAAGERAGTYAVTITRDGYRTWSQFDVEVGEDECHVIPVSLLAQIQPTS